MKSPSAFTTLLMVYFVTTAPGHNYIGATASDFLRMPALGSTAHTRQEVIRNPEKEFGSDDVPNALAQYRIQGHKNTMRRMKTTIEDKKNEEEKFPLGHSTLMEKYLRYFSYLMVKDKINKPRKQNLYGRHKYPKWV